MSGQLGVFLPTRGWILTLPVKSLLDGKYHLTGELRVANKEQICNLMKMLGPICRAVPGADIILVTPIHRYMYVPCCSKHCDRTEAETAKIKSDMLAIKRNIRSILYMEKISSVKFVDPLSVCCADVPSSYSDHVHLIPQEYEKLTDAVMDCVAGEPMATNSGESAGQPTAKRPRLMSGAVNAGAGRGRGRGGWRGGKRGGRYGRGRRTY